MEAKYAVRTLYWLALIVVSSLVAWFLRSHCPRPPAYADAASSIVGLILAVYGVLLNAIAGRTLRLYGHSRPSRRFQQPDRLVSVGLYSCSRHPAQNGLALLAAGAALLAGGAWGLLAAPIALAGGMWFILEVEEPEARRVFGNDYCDYERRVPAVSPALLSPRCIARGLRAVRGKRPRATP